MLANCTTLLKPFFKSKILSPTFRLLGKIRFDFDFLSRASSSNVERELVFKGIDRSLELVFAF
jgi:hypothetical protein